MFETPVEENEEEQGNTADNPSNNGTNKANNGYGLMLYVLTFIRLSKLNLLETLQQPIGVVFSVLSVEMERVKRESEQLKRGLKPKI